MKLLLYFISLLIGASANGKPPTLRFDEGITWKQVFDSGFRPKHLVGLERKNCVCLDQGFRLEFKDKESSFTLDKGRLLFQMPVGEEIHLIWHQGGHAITLEEGKSRVAEFKALFEGYIVQDMTMPKVIDPSGLVDAGNDENNIKARVGKYLIFFGFDNSYGTEKPIIPHFYIALSYPGKPDYKAKSSSEKVKPPAGYEWYSLDPKINTPDPGTGLNPTAESDDPPPEDQTTLPRQEGQKDPVVVKANAEKSGRVWLWGVGIFMLLVFAGVFRKRHFSKHG